MYKGPVVVFLLFICWSIASSWYYVTEIKQAYPTKFALIEKKEPLFFGYNDYTPYLGVSFQASHQLLLENLSDSNRLLVVGKYANDENNNSSFPNLGMARAHSVVRLFPMIDSSRFGIRSQLLDSGEAKQFSKNHWMKMVDFHVLNQNEFVRQTEYGADIYTDAVMLNPQLKAFFTFIGIEKNTSSFSIMDVSFDSLSLESARAKWLKDVMALHGVDTNHIEILLPLTSHTESPHLKLFIHDAPIN